MIALNNFTGIIPKADSTKLPDGAATVAVDCDFTSGRLGGIPVADTQVGYTGNKSGFVHVDSDGTKRIYTLGYDANFARGPVQQDDHKRFYWTGKNGSATEFKFARVADNASGGNPSVSYKVGVAKFGLGQLLIDNSIDINGNAVTGVTLDPSKYYLGGYMTVPVKPPVEFSEAKNVRVSVLLVDGYGEELKDITSDVTPWPGGALIQGVGTPSRGWYGQYNLKMSKTLAQYNAITVGPTKFTAKTIDMYVTGSTVVSAKATVWYATTYAADGSEMKVPKYAQITDGQQVTDLIVGNYVQVGAIGEASLSAKLMSPTTFSVDGSAFPASLSSSASATSSAASSVSEAASIAIRVQLDYNGATYTATFHQDALLSQAFTIGSGISGAVSKVDDLNWTLNLIFGEDLSIEHRAYIFTLVNRLGEESAPFGPIELVINPGRDRVKFFINNTRAYSVGQAISSGYYPLHGVRVYRTAPGSSTNTNYYYSGLAKIAGETTGLLNGDSYFDVSVPEGDSTVFYDETNGTALGFACTTIDYIIDVSELQKLQGLTTLYNGILAAFKDNEVWYSEPYKPWCWKRANVHTLPHKVVALLPQEQGVYVLTERFPYYASGATPDQMMPTRIPSQFPCIGKSSATTVNGAAIYFSPDGPVFLEGGGARLDTMAFNREAWRRDWASYVQSGGTVALTAYGHRLLAYFPTPIGSVSGYVYDMDTQAWTTITQAMVSHMTTPPGTFGSWSDNLAFWSGSGNWKTYGTGDTTALWEWQSKDFMLPYPTNFGVMQLFGTGEVAVNVYVDGSLIHTQAVVLSESGVIIRLPSGRMSMRWSFGLKASVTNTTIKAVNLAVSVSELRGV